MFQFISHLVTFASTRTEHLDETITRRIVGGFFIAITAAQSGFDQSVENAYIIVLLYKGEFIERMYTA